MPNKSKPSYLKLMDQGKLTVIAGKARQQLAECNLCPHECGTNRSKNRGFYQAGDKAIIASYGPHFGEESPLVGTRGSGTIFFAYCNIR